MKRAHVEKVSKPCGGDTWTYDDVLAHYLQIHHGDRRRRSVVLYELATRLLHNRCVFSKNTVEPALESKGGGGNTMYNTSLAVNLLKQAADCAPEIWQIIAQLGLNMRATDLLSDVNSKSWTKEALLREVCRLKHEARWLQLSFADFKSQDILKFYWGLCNHIHDGIQETHAWWWSAHRLFDETNPYYLYQESQDATCEIMARVCGELVLCTKRPGPGADLSHRESFASWLNILEKTRPAVDHDRVLVTLSDGQVFTSESSCDPLLSVADAEPNRSRIFIKLSSHHNFDLAFDCAMPFKFMGPIKLTYCHSPHIFVHRLLVLSLRDGRIFNNSQQLMVEELIANINRDCCLKGHKFFCKEQLDLRRDVPASIFQSDLRWLREDFETTTVMYAWMSRQKQLALPGSKTCEVRRNCIHNDNENHDTQKNGDFICRINRFFNPDAR